MDTGRLESGKDSVDMVIVGQKVICSVRIVTAEILGENVAGTRTIVLTAVVHILLNYMVI